MNKLSKTEYKPDYVSPPGETLQETLEMLGISQAELAERTGRPKKTINEIIQGKAAITPETALQLELVLQVPAAFWLARESKYRSWLARQDRDSQLKENISFLDNIPIKDMVSYKWIEQCRGKLEQARSILSFFGVVSADKIPPLQDVAFRRSEAFATNPWALAAWLRKGELEAQRVSCSKYDGQAFLEALQKVRSLTAQEPEVFVPQLKQLCASAGVTVVFVRELPKTSVSGATRWLSGSRPLIQLSLRYKSNDMIWFAFFHEAGHVYCEHAKREILLEKEIGRSLDQREEEANKFATDILIPEHELNRFVQQGSFSRESIVKFAKKIGIAPGIVVGRLQYEELLERNRHNSLKTSFSWEQWCE